jgi:hypothetical protein
MKIICLECHRKIGEKFPFDDTRETHTICRDCFEQRLIEAGKEGLRKEFIRISRSEVSLKFDPEVDSLGVE